MKILLNFALLALLGVIVAVLLYDYHATVSIYIASYRIDMSLITLIVLAIIVVWLLNILRKLCILK